MTSPLEAWVGYELKSVTRREHDWSFDLAKAGALSVSCPWRIVTDSHIAHADTDDGRKFGLSEPVDGVVRATDLLSGKKIVTVDACPITGDLKIRFSDETQLECWNNSSGYEGWHAIAVRDGRKIDVIAQGGGALAVWDE